MNPKHLPDFFHKMEEQGHITTPSGPSPITHDSSPSSSSPPPAAQPDESEETEVQQQPWRWQPNYVFHCFHMTVTSLVSDDVRNDAWSCLIVLLTFWFFGQSLDYYLQTTYLFLFIVCFNNCELIIFTSGFSLSTYCVEF